MPDGIIGKKVGMTRIFNANGDAVPVTVIQAGPCPVVQLKMPDQHGYAAAQIGFASRRKKLFAKPQLGHFARAKVEPTRWLREVRIKADEKLEIGSTIDVTIFKVGEKVNVTGISRGLGFQGVVRRHHFAGGPKTHGQSDRWRAPGSVGGSSFPSRTWKGMRMAGHMGSEKVTVRNLSVEGIDKERHLILVKGAVPGKPNTLLTIKKVSK